MSAASGFALDELIWTSPFPQNTGHFKKRRLNIFRIEIIPSWQDLLPIGWGVVLSDAKRIDPHALEVRLLPGPHWKNQDTMEPRTTCRYCSSKALGTLAASYLLRWANKTIPQTVLIHHRSTLSLMKNYELPTKKKISKKPGPPSIQWSSPTAVAWRNSQTCSGRDKNQRTRPLERQIWCH